MAEVEGRQREHPGAPLLVLVAVVAICMVGGTTEAYPLPRGIAQVFAALVIAWCIAQPPTRLPPDPWLRALCLAAPLLVAVQAVPLPPDVWSRLPGREPVVALDAAMGWRIWRPLTLDWEASFEVALFLVPCLALLLAGARERWSRSLAGAFAIGGGLAALIAILQALNPDWLRPFASAHEAYAIGPFVNRNHLALFVTCCALLAIGWAHDPEEAGMAPLRPFFAWGALVLAGLAVLLSGSRSGLVIYGIALLALGWSWFAALWGRVRASLLTALVAILAIAGLAVVAIPGGPLAAVAQRNPIGDDRRFEIWPAAAELIAPYWPVGSGFGTFREVYAAAEPLAEVRPLYVNHAHNDYLELLIEGGIAAAVLLAAFFGWLIWRSYAIFRDWPQVTPLRGAAALCLWLIVLQSLVEYPARTASVAALGGFCMALVAIGAGTKKRI